MTTDQGVTESAWQNQRRYIVKEAKIVIKFCDWLSMHLDCYRCSGIGWFYGQSALVYNKHSWGQTGKFSVFDFAYYDLYSSLWIHVWHLKLLDIDWSVIKTIVVLILMGAQYVNPIRSLFATISITPKQCVGSNVKFLLHTYLTNSYMPDTWNVHYLTLAKCS